MSIVPPSGVATLIVPRGSPEKGSVVLPWRYGVPSRATSRSTSDSTTAATLVEATAMGTTEARANALNAREVVVEREDARNGFVVRADHARRDLRRSPRVLLLSE
ncbi:hypothetical protein [Gordonia paraffinivorans]|uniref:hypothetical protein n=1 Tax=Gordonia paraffinivorans TaxID=175628 RepID=UPI001FFADEFD|nr:hypothetical protein [Gordonia paraffinivorans]